MLKNRILILLFFALPLIVRSQVQEQPQVLKGKLTATTIPLRNWIPGPNETASLVPTRDRKGLIFARDLEPLIFTDYGSRHFGQDPLLQKGFGIPLLTNIPGQVYEPIPKQQKNVWIERDGGALGKNFEGVPYTNISPADPTISVGPNHIIQMVNGTGGSAYFRIFDKSGNALSPLAYFDQLPGTSFNGAGDCITWYDQLTDRYVMTEFGDSAQLGASVNTLIVAVTKSNDPLGQWYVYEFSDASFFPDYPKYANWQDAWYGMTRDFTSSYVGNSVWAFNKFKMISGDPSPEVQRIRLSDPDNKFNTMCPVSLLGNTPAPAGTPGYFLYYNDDSYTSSPTDVDSMGIISFHVDFNDPTRSFAKVEQSLAVSPFKSTVCPTRNCAPSPAGNGYDVISNRIMNRPYYRNFGTYQSIVSDHTVDATGSAVSGIRWYEFRNISGSWNVHQQGTFSPQESANCAGGIPLHRFMGAIASNSSGQIAMAYNNSGIGRYASISFTGRNESDPLNLMSYAETDAVIGKDLGTFGNRWGDYSEIVPDVLDDSLFWFTAMYGDGNSEWKTKILSFRLRPNLELDARLVSIDEPNLCESSCSPDVQPKITIRNLGSTQLNKINIGISVNGSSPITQTWTGILDISQQINYTLPLTTLPPGSDTIRIFISDPNDGNDLNKSNDTATVIISIGAIAAMPLLEGFENPVFPPSGWTSIGDGTSSFHWNLSHDAAHTGNGSTIFKNFDLNEPGRQGDLRSPLLDIQGKDSADVSFWVAAAIQSVDHQDTLELLVSMDCGKTQQSIWKKWGPELATRNGYSPNSFIPTAAEWRKETIDLTPFKKTGNIILTFRNTNSFGNNIYVDDIDIETIEFAKNDAVLDRILSPDDIVCSSTLSPEISVINAGKDTLKTLKISYSIDGGSFLVNNWSGTLSRLEGTKIILPGSVTPGQGQHNLTVFLSDPNGLMDGNTLNDTAQKTFGFPPLLTLPLKEGFENPSFPPPGWTRLNPDGSVTWERTTKVAYIGQASAWLNNFNYTFLGQQDALITPLLKVEPADSIYLDFQVSAVTTSPASTPNLTSDTLTVLLSTDCGKQYTTVYQKWGAELQTTGDLDIPHPSEFFPSGVSQWRKEHVNITKSLSGHSPFLIQFRNTTNHENNIFIDEIHSYSEILPASLKENGYLISPNPFHDRITLRLWPDASSLLGYEIFNSAGQLVLKKDTGIGSSYSTQEILTSHLSNGIYLIRMRFRDTVVIKKLIRQ